MKKKLSLVISAALLISLMSACGSADSIDPSDTLSVFGSTGDTETETLETVSMSPVTATPTPSTSGGVYTPTLDEDGNVVQGDEPVATDDKDVSQKDAAVSPSPSGTSSGGGISNSNDAAVSASPSPSSSNSGKSGSGSSSGTKNSTLAKALEDVLENSSLPGQTSSDGCKYALADVDGDGSSEVIVRYPSGSGTKEAICSVSSDGKLVVQKQSYVGATYYSNGDIVIGSSSTKGYSGSKLSPYTILVYDSDSGSYTESVSVDGWDKTLSAVTKDDDDVEDLDGGDDEEEAENSFPDAVDLDGNGYIYIINGGSDGDEMVDDAEYQAWYASILGGATKVSVSFSNLTEAAVEDLD